MADGEVARDDPHRGTRLGQPLDQFVGTGGGGGGGGGPPPPPPPGPAGFTATSLASVSAAPPLLSFGIGTGSSSWPAVSASEYVGVHLLGDHQEELATTFARSGADRFAAPTAWREGPHGVPVLDGVLAWLVCRVVGRVPAGDHRIVLAQLLVGDCAGMGSPLLYHQGRYNGLRD